MFAYSQPSPSSVCSLYDKTEQQMLISITVYAVLHPPAPVHHTASPKRIATDFREVWRTTLHTFFKSNNNSKQKTQRGKSSLLEYAEKGKLKNIFHDFL